MKNVTFYIALTVGGVTWFFIVWALVVVANRSNAPEPSTDEDVKRAVVLAIMTKRNSRNPMAFAVEKVAVVGNTICMTYSGQNAFGEYTGEQVLIEKNGNEPWYSAQEGFIARKCLSQSFGKSGISSSTIVAVKEIHFAITLPELSARMCLNRQIEPPRSGFRRLDSFR